MQYSRIGVTLTKASEKNLNLDIQKAYGTVVKSRRLFFFFVLQIQVLFHNVHINLLWCHHIK